MQAVMAVRVALVMMFTVTSTANYQQSVQIDLRSDPTDLLKAEPALGVAANHARSAFSTKSFVEDWLRCLDGTKASSSILKAQIILTVDSANVGRDSAKRRVPDGFTVHVQLGDKDTNTPSQLVVQGQSVLGAAYGLYHVTERCQLDPCNCWKERVLQSQPSFTLRTLSEEGQLLDLPDVAYRSHVGPDYLNSELVQEECERLLQLVPYMLQHRFNSLTILHHDLEEYVDYTYLSGIEVYSADDPHRNRSKALSAIVKDFVQLMQAFHLTVFFQPYEVSCPPQLCEKLKLHAGSADLQRVLVARYKEFFERTGADGIIVTVSDSWSPRAGYIFQKVWSTAEELAQVATAFYNAVEEECGKQLVFRLWEWNGESDWKTLVEQTPGNTTFSVKVTAGDYLLDQPIHPVIANTSLAPTQRPIMILVDIFREYNGWGKTICYVQQWKERLEQAWRLGVRMLNIWGAWSPGCTWPDSGREIINGSAAHPKSWQGLWNDYRVFLPTTDTNFSGARPNAYLISRLGWNVEDALVNITNDFGALYFGKENSAAITQLLFLTQDAYLNAQSRPHYIADYRLTWATVFNPVATALAEFVEKTNYSELESVNALVEEAADKMDQLLTSVNQSSVPDPSVLTHFRAAVAKTRAHLLTLTTWRAIFLLNSSLATAPAENVTKICQALGTSLSSWQELIVFWSEKAADEGSDWEITQPSAKLASRPSFFHNWISFNDYIVKIRTSSETACKTAPSVKGMFKR